VDADVGFSKDGDARNSGTLAETVKFDIEYGCAARRGSVAQSAVDQRLIAQVLRAVHVDQKVQPRRNVGIHDRACAR
jgi:hypothetical protein